MKVEITTLFAVAAATAAALADHPNQWPKEHQLSKESDTSRHDGWNRPHNHHNPDAWWKEAIVYQVYPASFKESRSVENAIGWGDINGIIEKLDHIQSLGTDIVWLSPFYDSPLQDLGYDISNYDSVDPHFGGKIEDIKVFIKEVHKRGMKTIFDLVINHSSNQHEWFKQSASSKTSPYRDWYHWAPGQIKNGSMYPPNNWAGNNNGSAWKYDEQTQEYYLNLFNYFQPDFNWDNPITRQAIFHYAMEFWLNMGIDGFRMDAFSFYSKPAGLPDVPANDDKFHDARSLYSDGPHEHEYLHQMNREVLSKYDTFTVGEYLVSKNMTEIQKYVGASRQEVNTIFLTNMVDIGRDGYNPVDFNLTGWRDAINFTQAVGSPAAGDGWNTVFLENHDIPRSISRFGNDSAEFRVQSGKVLSMLLSTLSGTLFIYQGQEIGQINVPEGWNISEYRDRNSLLYYQNATENGVSSEKALENLHHLARDNARTPFNWDRQGGFSANSSTWTPQDNLEINLADQVNDKESVYNFWVEMLKLRKQHKDLFIRGGFELLDTESPDFFIYQKYSNSGRAIVILNLARDGKTGVPPVDIPGHAQLIAQTHECSDLTFQPFEGRVYLC